MACGKKSNNAPTEEFILESPAPVDVAAKISAIYRELSEKVIRYKYFIFSTIVFEIIIYIGFNVLKIWYVCRILLSGKRANI